ncbi:DNA methyltransferase [Leptotrichia sp. HSP-342]|uniref:Methyltransferase n=1 Tax=Leptotrichia mesophila TaxID=3239303 RepID=A0AB39VBS4_9FUSO
MKNELLTTKQAATHIGVSISTLYRMIDKGMLVPNKTPGGQRRFSIEMLDTFLESSKKIVAPQKPFDYKKNKDLECLDVMEEKVKYNDEEKPKVDKRNVLNDLTGTEWLPSTKSYFYQKGLGSKHPHAQIEREHPAPFSFQDIESLILFFTKKGMSVLDPFGGVGSTAKACALNERVCTSIELQEKWNSLSKKRLEIEVGERTSLKHTFVNGDSRIELKKMLDSSFDFIVTSPPYWSILNKKADHKVKKERLANNLATNYSEDKDDLANIDDYNDFLEELVENVFLECGRVLKVKKYMCLVVSDFRNKSEFISFHSDLIQRLNNRKLSDGGILKLQGVKILIQNHKSLLPYGYPFAYVENIHHQYVLIFRKN